METIHLQGKEITAKRPDSLALLFEFAVAWSLSEDATTNARLCAAAIGIYIESHGVLPIYKPLKETPVSYGYKCLESLLKLKVQGSEVYNVGTKLLTDMAKNLPRNEAIEKKKDFFHSTNSENGS